jgi:glycosyltransferase involved in cell wall biosynthesis
VTGPATPRPDRQRHWVLVCGGFHHQGGMDRANAALARYLLRRGTPVHLVAHSVDDAFRRDWAATISLVARPAGSVLAGELLLERAAGRVAGALRREGARVCIVGNGASFGAADLNWVHCVHHAWPCRDAGAPVAFRARNRAFKAWSRLRERRALRAAPLVIANSRRTARDVHALGVDPDRVRTVYLGSDPAWVPPSGDRRRDARARWCQDPARPLVAFVGALGHDTNKGVDVLLDAWQRLGPTGWTADLVVAGPGARARWEARAAAAGMRVRFTGLTDQVGDLLDAADLLVSPVAYEAYGLAAHEALCRGVPVAMTKTAGLVERLTPDLSDMLLPSSPDAGALAEVLRRWSADPDGWRCRIRPAGERLRAHGEDRMAEEIVDAAGAEAP